MNKKKRYLAFLMTICLVFSCTINVFAMNWTPSVDKTMIAAGEKVNVTLTNDEERITQTMAYKLYFDETLFEMTGSTTAPGQPTMTLSKIKHINGRAYHNISCIDPTSQGLTVKTGEVCTVEFTAKQDVTQEVEALFEAEFENFMEKNFTLSYDHGAGAPVKVTVTPAGAQVEGYQVAMSGDVSITRGENAVVTLSVNNSGKATYNAYYFEVKYDADVLAYSGVTPTDATVKDENGVLTVAGYGSDKTCGTDGLALTFTGKNTGTGTVTVTKANVDEKANASAQDAPAATISSQNTATITVNGYTVNLPEDFTGEATVEPGTDYTFTAKDKNYDYKVIAKVGDAAVPVTDNGDGTFTIAGKDITGDLVITAEKTAKTYTVTVTGNGSDDVTADSTATYGQDYTFRVNKDTNYRYGVSVTIAGKAYAPQRLEEESGYVILGADITGDIEIKVSKASVPSTNTELTFSGSGSADVEGGTSQSAPNGKDYTFTIKKENGYNYVVRIGDTVIEPNTDGSYTIAAALLTGKDMQITIEKTPVSDVTVEVSEYVKLDGKSMWLVTAAGTVSEGKVLAYNETPMFWSDEYDAYAYLVVSEENIDTVKEQAQKAVTEADAEKATITYDGDVNGTKVTDVNDSQLTYNIYNAQYEDFSEVSMLKFLCADVNADKQVNVADAAAIISEILK